MTHGECFEIYGVYVLLPQGMASLDDKLRGNRKENYVGGESDSEREEGPSPYASPPVSDGLPQVRR